MKKVILIAVCLFLAGASNGTMDALQFYSGWKKFENTDFWNPSKSWTNKWAKDSEGVVLVGKERFWGSSRWFVAFTDGWHLVKFWWITFMVLPIVLALDVSKPEGFRIRLGWFQAFTWLGLFLAFRLVMAAGFHLTYTLIF